MRPVYKILKEKIKEKISPNIRFNPSPQDYIGLVNKINFCGLSIKNDWIRIDFPPAASEDIKNMTRFERSASGWGYVRVRTPEEVDDELLMWIKISYEKTK